MSDVLFFAALVGFVLLIVWLVQNDTGEPESGQRGLFGMHGSKADAQPGEPTKPQPRWRSGRNKRT